MVRRLSAGRGIRHTEMNPAGWAPARYIEMWVPPDPEGPRTRRWSWPTSTRPWPSGGLVPVASGRGPCRARWPSTRPGGVLWAGRLAPGEAVILPDAPHVHLFVVLGGGVLDTGGLAGAGPLAEGDSVRLTAAGSPVFTAGGPPAPRSSSGRRASRQLRGRQQRVDRRPELPHLEVEVGPGRHARLADEADHLAGGDLLADRGVDPGLVGVERGQPVAVVDDDGVAVTAPGPGPDDDPARRRP